MYSARVFCVPASVSSADQKPQHVGVCVVMAPGVLFLPPNILGMHGNTVWPWSLSTEG